MSDAEHDDPHQRGSNDESVGTVDPISLGQQTPINGYLQQQSYSRGAVIFAFLGVLALLGASAAPAVRPTLVALGGVGLFGAALIRYLTPARFVSPETGESAYAAFAATAEEIVSELDLRQERIYVPTSSDSDGQMPVRLFVPGRTDFDIPDPGAMQSLFVEDDYGGGIAVPPTGGQLFDRSQCTVRSDAAECPEQLVVQLTDALINEFELVEREMVEGEDGSVTVTFSNGAYGPLDRFDHPVVSFVAVGLAETLEVPVAVDMTAAEHDRYLATYELNEQPEADF